MPFAAVAYEKHRPLQVEEVHLRAVRGEEVLVRVAACGVCHSDLSVLKEHYPCPTPVVLGHEAAGVVEAVGPRVTKVHKGDHVNAVWRPSCGECRYCRADRPQLCRLADDPTSTSLERVFAGNRAVYQFLGVGGFAEYTILDQNAVIKIDPSLPLEKAALLGCAVLSGWGAAQAGARIRQGDEVAVFGCGGAGLNILQGAAKAGAGTIIAIDRDQRKLELAREFGATRCLNAATRDLAKQVRNLTREREGVDYAFDSVGSAEVIEAAYASVCRGGEVVCVGIAHRDETLSLSQVGLVLMEKGIRGSLGGSQSPYQAVPRLVEAYLDGQLNLDELASKRYPLAEVNQAMSDLREGKNGRGILVFGT
jgi:S-(hydroxymethyl)glutathione dehydrogenase/alcohol dehydrogenase